MIQKPEELQRLIEEYGELRNLQGITPQRRGQLFNDFLKRLFLCWGIEANSNMHGSGEIDVGFNLDGRRFLLEAKWEKEPVDIGPIAKLQKRVRQRLGGTVGFLLSMSGFSPDAVRDLKEGEQLWVLLLTREHLEAMLAGFVPPAELINKVLEKASFYGEALAPLRSLWTVVQPDELGIDIRSTGTGCGEQLIEEALPGFQASVIASNLPFGHSGVVETQTNKILLTLRQGVYELDYSRQVLDVFLGIPGCSRNGLVTDDGAVFVIRKAGVACLKEGELRIAGGGFRGNACLLHGKEGDVWVFSNGYPWGNGGVPQITRLGSQIGEEERYDLDDVAATNGTNASLTTDGHFLVVSTARHIINLLEVDSRSRRLVAVRNADPDLTNPMGLASLGDSRFVIASDGVLLSESDPSGSWVKTGVMLSELDPSKLDVKQVARLRLQGSVTELVASAEMGGYLFSHYQNRAGESAGIVIRWWY